MQPESGFGGVRFDTHWQQFWSFSSLHCDRLRTSFRNYEDASPGLETIPLTNISVFSFTEGVPQ